MCHFAFFEMILMTRENVFEYHIRCTIYPVSYGDGVWTCAVTANINGASNLFSVLTVPFYSLFWVSATPFIIFFSSQRQLLLSLWYISLLLCEHKWKQKQRKITYDDQSTSDSLFFLFSASLPALPICGNFNTPTNGGFWSTFST